MTQGQTAAESLNDSTRHGSRRAARASRSSTTRRSGTELHDLSSLIGSQSARLRRRSPRRRSSSRTSSPTSTSPSPRSRPRRTTSRRTIGVLPEVLEQAGPALDALNASFPPTRAFAREILPGVRETPATIEASFPWIEQVRALVSPAELQGLVNDLRPAIDDLAQLTDDSIKLLPKVDDVSRCFIENVLPAGDIVIDGLPSYPHETGVENYKEFWQSQVALSGESQNFDGNGQYTRFQPGGGDQTFSTGQHADRRRADVREPEPRRRSARFRSTRRASRRTGVTSSATRTTLPKVNENAVHGSAAHEARDPQAPARLHRDPLPGRRGRRHGGLHPVQPALLPARRGCPGIGTDFYTVEAEFETGQAVVPGQGQTVNIAGVKVGDIGKVELEDGVAVVELKIQDKYKPIYRDATMLLRPKTGLKDMFVELDPGTQAAGELPEGGRIALAQTRPDVNPDEILAAARRRHARVPPDPRQRGRRGVHRRPVQGVRRSPTPPTCARRSSASSRRTSTSRSSRASCPERRENADARDPQLPPARRGARREGHPARRAGRLLERELPGLRRAGGRTCGARSSCSRRRSTTTKTTLGKVETLADELGPSFQALRPFARNLGPALEETRPGLRATTPIIRDEIRPFARIGAQPGARAARARPRSWLRRRAA